MISAGTAKLFIDLYSPGAIIRKKCIPTTFFMMKVLNYSDISVDILNSVINV